MNDRRNEKTEQLIKEIFLKLLKEKSLNKITVAEISRLANLGRGTFYLHYDDVYDLYENIERKIIDDLKSIFKSAYPTTDKNNCDKLTRSLIEYIENNKELMIILIKSNEGNTLYKIKKDFYMDVINENKNINPLMDSKYKLVESIFIVSGIIGVLEKWIINDYSISSESISNMLNIIINKVNGK